MRHYQLAKNETITVQRPEGLKKLIMQVNGRRD